MLRLAIAVLVLLVTANAEYNEQLEQKLCRLAVASYCRKADVEKWDCGPCKNSPLVMKNVRTF